MAIFTTSGNSKCAVDGHSKIAEEIRFRKGEWLRCRAGHGIACATRDILVGERCRIDDFDQWMQVKPSPGDTMVCPCGEAYGPGVESAISGVTDVMRGQSPSVEATADSINLRGRHWFGAEGVCVKCVQSIADSTSICPATPLKRSAALREARIWLGLTPKPTYPHCSEPDRNLYYDGIILAARKKREKQNAPKGWAELDDYGHRWGVNVDACMRCELTGTEIAELPYPRSERDIPRCDGGESLRRGRTVSRAISQPLSFEPRVGWKPGDCE